MLTDCYSRLFLISIIAQWTNSLLRIFHFCYWPKTSAILKSLWDFFNLQITCQGGGGAQWFKDNLQMKKIPKLFKDRALFFKFLASNENELSSSIILTLSNSTVTRELQTQLIIKAENCHKYFRVFYSTLQYTVSA